MIKDYCRITFTIGAAILMSMLLVEASVDTPVVTGTAVWIVA